MTAVDTLLATMRRVDQVKVQAAAAVNIPAQQRTLASRVSIQAYDHQHRGAADLANAIATRLAEDMAAAGAVERDRIIAACAAELEAIRADLPRQAAAAAIEMGRMARNMVRM